MKRKRHVPKLLSCITLNGLTGRWILRRRRRYTGEWLKKFFGGSLRPRGGAMTPQKTKRTILGLKMISKKIKKQCIVFSGHDNQYYFCVFTVSISSCNLFAASFSCFALSIFPPVP
jgi:hypothetical protein